MSGQSYEAACNPAISNEPREESWPEPQRRKVGKGYQYVYPAEVAEQVATHMEEVGSGLMYGDPDSRAEGRALLRDARRWREEP